MAVLSKENSKYASKSWTLTEKGKQLLRNKLYTLAFIGHNIADEKIKNFVQQINFIGKYEKYDDVIKFINANRGNPEERTFIVFQIIADLENEISFNIASRDAITLKVPFHFISHTSEFLSNPQALTQILHTINMCQQGVTGNTYNIDEFLQSQAQIEAPTTMTEEYSDEDFEDFDPSNIKFLFITSSIPNEEDVNTIRLQLSDIGFESELLFYNSPLDIDFSKYETNKLAIINTVNDSKAVALDITTPEVANKLILYMHLNGFERLLKDCSDVYIWISEVIDNYVINSDEDPTKTNLANLQQVFLDTAPARLYNNMTLPGQVTKGKLENNNLSSTINEKTAESLNSNNDISSNNANYANNSNLASNLNVQANAGSGINSNTGTKPASNSHNNLNNNPNSNSNSNTNSNQNLNQNPTPNQNQNSNFQNSRAKTNLSPVVVFVGVNPNSVPPQLVNDLVRFVLGHSNNNYQFFVDYNDLYNSMRSNPNLLFNIINCIPINYDFVKAANFGFLLQLQKFEQVNYDNARVIASLNLLIDLVKSGSYKNIINLA